MARRVLFYYFTCIASSSLALEERKTVAYDPAVEVGAPCNSTSVGLLDISVSTIAALAQETAIVSFVRSYYNPHASVYDPFQFSAIERQSEATSLADGLSNFHHTLLELAHGKCSDVDGIDEGTQTQVIGDRSDKAVSIDRHQQLLAMKLRGSPMQTHPSRSDGICARLCLASATAGTLVIQASNLRTRLVSDAQNGSKPALSWHPDPWVVLRDKFDKLFTENTNSGSRFVAAYEEAISALHVMERDTALLQHAFSDLYCTATPTLPQNNKDISDVSSSQPLPLQKPPTSTSPGLSIFSAITIENMLPLAGMVIIALWLHFKREAAAALSCLLDILVRTARTWTTPRVLERHHTVPLDKATQTDATLETTVDYASSMPDEFRRPAPISNLHTKLVTFLQRRDPTIIEEFESLFGKCDANQMPPLKILLYNDYLERKYGESDRTDGEGCASSLATDQAPSCQSVQRSAECAAKLRNIFSNVEKALTSRGEYGDMLDHLVTWNVRLFQDFPEEMVDLLSHIIASDTSRNLRWRIFHRSAALPRDHANRFSTSNLTLSIAPLELTAAEAGVRSAKEETPPLEWLERSPPEGLERDLDSNRARAAVAEKSSAELSIEVETRISGERTKSIRARSTSSAAMQVRPSTAPLDGMTNDGLEPGQLQSGTTGQGPGSTLEDELRGFDMTMFKDETP